MKETIIALALAVNTLVASVSGQPVYQAEPVLASHELDLTNRLDNAYGSSVFADNILLALHYLKNDVNDLKKDSIIISELSLDWDKVRKPFEVSLTLQPSESFAYHQNTLAEFNSPKYTMNSRFYGEEGYKFLTGLGGNGVCHLASLINWTASNARLAEDGESKRAGLEVVAKVNHDFWPVPGVPREYGTSIFYAPNGGNSQNQNLYIKNNFDYPVKFEFKADQNRVKLTIFKEI